jgi:hypothetical protein
MDPKWEYKRGFKRGSKKVYGAIKEYLLWISKVFFAGISKSFFALIQNGIQKGGSKGNPKGGSKRGSKKVYGA